MDSTSTPTIEIDMAEMRTCQQQSLEDVAKSTLNQSPTTTTFADKSGQEEAYFNAEEFCNKECTWPDHDPPIGWPRLVAWQERHRNMDLIRSFIPELRRLILYFGTQAARASKKLRAFDRENEDHLRCLPNSSSQLHGGLKLGDRQEELILELNETLSKYFSVVSPYLEMRKLFPAPFERHWTLMKALENGKMLEKGAALYFDDAESFSTYEPLPPSWVTRVVHSSVAKWLMSKFFRNGPCKNSMTVPNPELIIINVTHVLGTAFFLLGPIGAMMLAHLNNTQAFGLLAGFTLAFTAFISKMQAYDTQKTLIAACAYFAVMAAFAAATWKE